MNSQTRGPLLANGAYLCRDIDGQRGHRIAWVLTDGPYQETRANAALLAAAYTAFDHAGRELGIDAAKLAQSVDLAEVFRYALDYAQLHSKEQDRGNVGRADQVKAARATLAPLAALMGHDFSI